MYVVDTARLEDVLRQMQKAKTHFGFVVDEHGGIEGIITLEDLLEEIVGDISDEHDEEVNEQITPIDENSYLLDGALAVRDLNRRLKTSLPESEAYTTIGGFSNERSGPSAAARRNNRTRRAEIQIEKVERRRLLQVRLQLPEKKIETETAALESAAGVNYSPATKEVAAESVLFIAARSVAIRTHFDSPIFAGRPGQTCKHSPCEFSRRL